MAIAATITDNADGTGITAVITGSDGGPVKVRRATVGVSSIGSYSIEGARTGDGSVTVSGTGYYRWYVNDDSGQTSVVYVPATAEGDSPHERCLTMLKDRIDGLGLTTKEGTALPVVIRQAGDNNQANLSYPCILLGFIDQAEELLGGNNQNDDYGLPVLAQIVERTQWHADVNRARLLQWRHQILARTNNQRWDFRVPECWMVEAKPAPVISAPESKDRLDYREGLLAFRCKVRIRRNAA